MGSKVGRRCKTYNGEFPRETRVQHLKMFGKEEDCNHRKMILNSIIKWVLFNDCNSKQRSHLFIGMIKTYFDVS